MTRPQLFERVMLGKRTTYREYIEKPIVMPEIEQKQVVTLLTTLTISMLMSVYDQLKPHNRMAREIMGVEDQSGVLHGSTASRLIRSWWMWGNGAIKSMQDGLSGVSA